MQLFAEIEKTPEPEVTSKEDTLTLDTPVNSSRYVLTTEFPTWDNPVSIAAGKNTEPGACGSGVGGVSGEVGLLGLAGFGVNLPASAFSPGEYERNL